jgi:hypothetical protein
VYRATPTPTPTHPICEPVTEKTAVAQREIRRHRHAIRRGHVAGSTHIIFSHPSGSLLLMWRETCQRWSPAYSTQFTPLNQHPAKASGAFPRRMLVANCLEAFLMLAGAGFSGRSAGMALPDERRSIKRSSATKSCGISRTVPYMYSTRQQSISTSQAQFE